MNAPLGRAVWVSLALACIVLGLGVNRFGLGLAATPRDIVGDALWAVMMFAWLGLLLPRQPTMTRAALAVGACWAVELSQTLHTPTLDAWRQTTAGRLILGVGFDARDLVAYAAGVAAGVILERTLLYRPTSSRTK